MEPRELKIIKYNKKNMDTKNNSFSLIKILFKHYNQREIATVCDFELYYGLLCGYDNIVHLITTVCEELSTFANAPSFEKKEQSDAAVKRYVEVLGYGDQWNEKDRLVESLLHELLCYRVETKSKSRDSICSREFSQATLINCDVARLIKGPDEANPTTGHIDPSCVIQKLQTVNVSEYKPRLFGERHLSGDVVMSIRNLALSLSEEYNERWNLYLVRFDCLIKVFMSSGKPRETEDLRALLEVINTWRNGSYSRFRQLCLYDLYGATRECLKVEKVSSANAIDDIMDLYRKKSTREEESSYESFIKKIYIPEPPNRGGLPEGFSIKKFYSKFRRH